MINSIMEPASDWLAVTPSDTAKLAQQDGRHPRSIYTGAGGDIAVISHAGNTFTFAGLPAASILDIQPAIIKSTGTTATGIAALY